MVRLWHSTDAETFFAPVYFVRYDLDVVGLSSGFTYLLHQSVDGHASGLCDSGRCSPWCCGAFGVRPPAVFAERPGSSFWISRL